MVNSKKRIVVMLSFLALIFVFVIGISYAYYAAEVKGNNATDPSLKLTSGYLSIVYEGGSSSISGGSTTGTTTDLVYTKNFTVTNDGVADSNFGVWIKNYKVVDKEGNATTFTRPEDWTYTLKSGDTIIKSGTFPTSDEALISVYPLSMKETKNLTLTVTYNYITSEEGATDQTADMGKVLSFNITVTQAIDKLNDTSEGTLLYALNDVYQASIIRNESDLTTTPGQAASLENEAILATTEDDHGTSYYFRGNVQNNYVTYSNMCWRIVRIQGDGTIKLVLADWEHKCGELNGYSTDNDDSAFIMDTESVYITPYTNNYGASENVLFEASLVREKLENWASSNNFDTNLKENNYWCNDTSVISDNSGGYDSNGYWTNDKLLVTEWYELYNMGAYGRLNLSSTATPNLKCNFKGIKTNDVETTATRYPSPIGILTADELAFAGATNKDTNYTHYLTINAKSNNYWTMTPSRIDGGAGNYMFTMNNYGKYGEGQVYDENIYAIRPAVVLRKNVILDETISGQNGEINNPYVIAE